jgi:hypothetical protein
MNSVVTNLGIGALCGRGFETVEKILASEHSQGVLRAFVTFLKSRRLRHLEEIDQIDCYLDEVKSRGIDVDFISEDLWEDE